MESGLTLSRLGFYPSLRAGSYYRLIPVVVVVRELSHGQWSVAVGPAAWIAATVVFPSFEAAAVWMIAEGLCPEVV